MNQNVIPFKKWRVAGAFTLVAMSENRLRVEFAGTFCGRDHSGAVYLSGRGREIGDEYLNVVGSAVSPTRAARDAIAEAAQAVALVWAPAHPDAFCEADLEAARKDLASAEREALDLGARLAAAERKAAAAKSRVQLLGGEP